MKTLITAGAALSLGIYIGRLQILNRLTLEDMENKTKNRRRRDRKGEYSIIDNLIYGRERAYKLKLEEIIFDTREEAEKTLDSLLNISACYGIATVSDLYALAGITSTLTDDKYGWNNLRSVKVCKRHDGYIINLPMPQSIAYMAGIIYDKKG